MIKWSDIRASRTAEDPALEDGIRDERRLLEVVQRLTELREARGVTQRALAARLGVSQPNVSRIEGNDDLHLSTLGRYVSALDGALRISVRFPDGRDEILLDDRGSPLSIRLDAPGAMREGMHVNRAPTRRAGRSRRPEAAVHEAPRGVPSSRRRSRV
jgi:transcriptional regulator with XRE-family HTH domain